MQFCYRWTAGKGVLTDSMQLKLLLLCHISRLIPAKLKKNSVITGRGRYGLYNRQVTTGFLAGCKCIWPVVTV